MSTSDLGLIQGWFAGRLPDGWFSGADVTIEDDQIVIRRAGEENGADADAD